MEVRAGVLKTNNRESNIEALRIVLMLFILLIHYLTHGINSQDTVCRIICGFCGCAVNCYVLISGFYGIKFRFKGLWKLYATVAIWTLILLASDRILSGGTIGKSIIFSSLFSLSGAQWWFIQVYVYLFLCSPILNWIVSGIAKNQFVFLLIILTVLNVYMGFFRKGPINYDGYNIAQFIYLYFIGRFLKLHFHTEGKWMWLVIYILLSFLVLCLNQIDNPFFSGYNNPFIVMQAISLFLFFKQVDIAHSTFINKMAASALPAYLIQDSSLGYDFIYPMVNNIINGIGCYYLGPLLAIVIITFVASVLLDKIRILIFRPIDSVVLDKLVRLDDKLKPLVGEP